MCKFFLRLSYELVLESKATLLIENMDISRLIMYIQWMKEDKKKQIEFSERQGKKFRAFEHSGGSGGKWLKRSEGFRVLSPRLMLLGQIHHMIIDISFVVGFAHQVTNLRLVGLSLLHPTYLVDSVVSLIMVSARRGGIDILDMVILSTSSESAPL